MINTTLIYQYFCRRNLLIHFLCFFLVFMIQPEPNYSSEKLQTIVSAQEKLPELAKQFLDALQKNSPEEFQKCWGSFELLKEKILPRLEKEQTPTVAKLRKVHTDFKYREKKLKRIHSYIIKRFSEHKIDLKTLKVSEVSGVIEMPFPQVFSSSNIILRFKNDDGTIVEFNKLSGTMLEGLWYLTGVPSDFEFIRNGKRERVEIHQRGNRLLGYRPPVGYPPPVGYRSHEEYVNKRYQRTDLKFPTVDSQLIYIFQTEDTETKKVRVTILPHGNIQNSRITDAAFNGVFEVKIPHVKRILCYETGITDLTLKKINEHFAHSLEKLNVQSTKITDAGISFLKDCQKLKSLNLSGTAISDEGISFLNDCKQLKGLGLSGTKISDRCGLYLPKLINLNSLSLGETQVTDKLMNSLRNMENLQNLYLGDTDISDAGIKHLKTLDSLVSLSLSNTLIGNESINYLKDMKTLKTLSLEYTQISDEAVKHLQNMKFLTRLDVSRTDLTREAVAQLIKELPTTVILSDY